MSCILNHPAPDLHLVDLETGDSHSLMQIIEKNKRPTVVLFYATWSKACEDEVELFEAWSKNGHHRFMNFILVSVDQNVGSALAFLDTVNPKTNKPRVCRDCLHGETPTVLQFGCADVPEPYAVLRVPHKVMIDENGIVRRNAEAFHWDDIAGLLRYRQEQHATREHDKTSTFLFPMMIS